MADNGTPKSTEQAEARQTSGGGPRAGAEGGATGATQTQDEAPSTLGGGTATRTTIRGDERPSPKGE